MGRILAIIVALVMLMTLPTLALAQEEPAKYSFASAQGSKHITVTPGGEGMGMIYFYNIDGNRITHISLVVSQAPDRWQVEIQPPLGQIQVEIGGRVVTVTENLHVEPSELLLEEAKDVPAGMVCITVPNRGYALAKAANIIVRVPQSEEIGMKGEINISAVAEWLGQTGAVAIKQARDFDFLVEVVSETAAGEEKIIGQPGATERGEFYSIIMRWLPAIIAAAIAILAAVLIPFWVRRRHE